MTKFQTPTCVAIAMASWVALTGTVLAQTQQNGPSEPCVNSRGNSGDLSNKLSQSNGVICPPDVDQGMKAPTPNTGTMPVIPPPGNPGSNQNVQPK
jgi:hypothetical protein